MTYIDDSATRRKIFKTDDGRFRVSASGRGGSRLARPHEIIMALSPDPAWAEHADFLFQVSQHLRTATDRHRAALIRRLRRLLASAEIGGAS